MKGKCLQLVALIPGLLAVPAGMAGEKGEPSLSVGGLLFGDLYYVPSHHLDEGDGAAGLVLRRGYLTFNGKFTDNWFGRLRFEINQSGEFETYTLSTQVKDLYTGWNLGRQRLVVGLTSTITYDLIESTWGFRYLARTPLDLQGVPSRDTGVSLSGPLNASGTIAYRAMYGAGLEFGADSDGNNKYMGALTWKPADGWIIDFYADREPSPGKTDRTTLQLFAAHQGETLSWGVQYSNQDRQDAPPLELASVFMKTPLGDKRTLVGRVDHLFEPSPRGDDISYLPFDGSARATMFIGGIEFKVTPQLSITPNAVVTRYGHNDQGERPKTDVYLRLTLFVNFE